MRFSRLPELRTNLNHCGLMSRGILPARETFSRRFAPSKYRLTVGGCSQSARDSGLDFPKPRCHAPRAPSGWCGEQTVLYNPHCIQSTIHARTVEQ
jgi:hypothetical protein